MKKDAANPTASEKIKVYDLTARFDAGSSAQNVAGGGKTFLIFVSGPNGKSQQ